MFNSLTGTPRDARVTPGGHEIERELNAPMIRPVDAAIATAATLAAALIVGRMDELVADLVVYPSLWFLVSQVSRMVREGALR